MESGIICSQVKFSLERQIVHLSNLNVAFIYISLPQDSRCLNHIQVCNYVHILVDPCIGSEYSLQ